LARQLAGHRVAILPVVLTGGRLPAVLADIKAADLVTDWRAGVNALLRAIDAIDAVDAVDAAEASDGLDAGLAGRRRTRRAVHGQPDRLDFTGRVADACEDRYPDADVRLLRSEHSGNHDFLDVRWRDALGCSAPLAGGLAPDGLDDTVFESFIDAVHTLYRRQEPYTISEFVYGGNRARPGVHRPCPPSRGAGVEPGRV
jgi:hypothetical protein